MIKHPSMTPQTTEHGVQLGDVEFIWARNSKDFFFSNSILIHDTHPTLIDPSANFSYLEYLASQKKVSQVVNTHYHVDHRSLNSLFRKHAIYLCHKADKKFMSFENYLKFADQEKGSSYVTWLKGIFSSLDIKDPYFSKTLSDGQNLPLSGQAVEVLHLPGHTPGHIGLFFKDLDLIFTADVDLTPLGPWYANVYSNIDQFIASLKRLRATECTYYVSSHGSRVYNREQFLEKLKRFELAFEKRDASILKALKERAQPLHELSQIGIIYRKRFIEKDPLNASFERQMLQKHLERLEKMGEVKEESGIWRLKV